MKRVEFHGYPVSRIRDTQNLTRNLHQMHIEAVFQWGYLHHHCHHLCHRRLRLRLMQAPGRDSDADQSHKDLPEGLAAKWSLVEVTFTDRSEHGSFLASATMAAAGRNSRCEEHGTRPCEEQGTGIFFQAGWYQYKVANSDYIRPMASASD